MAQKREGRVLDRVGRRDRRARQGSQEIERRQLRRSILMSLVALSAVLSAACSEAERKALRDLVKDVSTNATQTEGAGRALQVISVFEQAQGLSESRQCQAAADIYCAAFRMVRDGCNDQTEFCQTIADALYGGSFPVFGFRACVAEAADQCTRLAGQQARLHRLCIDLRRQCGANN